MMPRDPGRPPEPADDGDEPTVEPRQPQGVPGEAIDRPTEDVTADTSGGGLGATIAAVVAVLAIVIVVFIVFGGGL